MYINQILTNFLVTKLYLSTSRVRKDVQTVLLVYREQHVVSGVNDLLKLFIVRLKGYLVPI